MPLFVRGVNNINLNLLSEYVRENINIFIDNYFHYHFTNEIRNRNDLDDIQKNFITENNLNNNQIIVTLYILF